jgi:tungstate transport system ATP-binding protein
MIRELRGERRMTIVLATHNVHQARRLADRVGLLIEGRFVEVGETDRFFNNPADGRTAAFLGGDMVY